jgi:hypothetical protein
MLEHLIGPQDLINEKGPEDMIKKPTANKRFGLVASRPQNNHRIPLELQNVSLFPNINYKNGSFCLIYAKDKLHFYKSLLK